MENLTKSVVPSTFQTSDGATISYYTVGHGPGLVIIHGAMSWALTQLELANALSDKYTVHIYSRRDRGLSGPYPPSVRKGPILNTKKRNSDSQTTPVTPVADQTYDPGFASSVLQTDLSDLAALIAHTNAVYLLGISSGAIIALESLLSPLPFESIQKTLIFEPPLSFPTPPSPTSASTKPGASPLPKTLPRLKLAPLSSFEAALSTTPPSIDSALVTAMLLTQFAPSFLNYVPHFLLRFLNRLACNAEDAANSRRIAAGSDDWGKVTMRQLGFALRYDFAVVQASSSGGVDRFAQLKGIGEGKVLLLSTSESPGYLREAVEVLGKVIEGVKTVEIEGASHMVMGNRDRRGEVEKAVGDIKEFFG